MKKLIILLIVPLFFGFKTGGEIDEKKMNRDIEIAKNILGTLIKTNNDSWFGGSSIDATYIKDYGVVFTIPEHLVYFHSGGSVIAIPDIPPIPDIDVDFETDIEFEDEKFEKQEKEELKKAEKEFKKQEKEIRKKEYELQGKLEELEARHEDMARVHAEARVAIAEARELENVYISRGGQSDINWEEVMITFMTDYADLIGQLKPSERIVVKQKAPYSEMTFIWAGRGVEEKVKQDNSSISAEVLRKDVSAYKTGKINKDEFIKRINIKKTEPPKKIADLEMFANIFDRFYSHDLTETFYSQGKPRYEMLEGYGAVFHIKAASGYSRLSGRASYRTGGSTYTVAPDDESSQKDAELYPKFKQDLKAFMLDYGRTIRSLADDEKVLLDIEINSCRNCNVPKSMELSVKMSTLKQYDQQKLSKEKAISQIEIKESM